MKQSLALLAPCLLMACAADAPPAPAPPHVVIVTVDGLRPDAISETGTPNLAGLVRDGAASLASQVPHPPETLPSHFSMATGQTPAGHGVRTNKALDHELENETLFTAVHAAGRRTALLVGKSKLFALAPRASADVVMGPAPGDNDWESGASAALAARFVADYPRERFGLAWIHLREPDIAGHATGWLSPEYRAALAEVDAALGRVLRAIRASGLPTTVILASDHGGHGKEHWGRHPADSIVPWICAGPYARAGTKIAESGVTDVGPTAAALLGVTLPEAEGRAVKECLPRP